MRTRPAPGSRSSQKSSAAWEPTRETIRCTIPRRQPAAEAGILEERQVGARRARLVGVEEVVDGRVVLVDGLLDRRPRRRRPHRARAAGRRGGGCAARRSRSARKRGSSRRRASTTWPSSHARRGWKAAKLMRAWSAMRVFSGSTVTGPLRSAARSSRSKISRIAGGLPAKCASSGAERRAGVGLVAVGERAAAVRARPEAQTTRPWRMVFSVTTRGSTNCSR